MLFITFNFSVESCMIKTHGSVHMVVCCAAQEALGTQQEWVSRHTVACRAAQEALGAHNGSEYINRNNKVAIFTHW